MTTIMLSHPPVYYQGGVSPAHSSVVGYESSRTRVARYSFTAPAEGGSHISFQIPRCSFGNGDMSLPLRFYIGRDPDSHADGNAGYAYHGDVVMNEDSGWYTAAGEAEVLLLPNQQYYLWIFPNKTKSGQWGWWYWSSRQAVATVSGAAGVVHIDVGNAFVTAIPCIDDGISFRKVASYIGTGSELIVCS